MSQILRHSHYKRGDFDPKRSLFSNTVQTVELSIQYCIVLCHLTTKLANLNQIVEGKDSRFLSPILKIEAETISFFSLKFQKTGSVIGMR